MEPCKAYCIAFSTVVVLHACTLDTLLVSAHSPGPIKQQAFSSICILGLPFFSPLNLLMYLNSSSHTLIHYSHLLYRSD